MYGGESVRAVDLIAKKRDGGEWTDAEIRFMINGYVHDDIPDYQMAAWAMAVYFRGMTSRETTVLTMAMAESGDLCDLSAIAGIKVDKHSTGGVGDTTTLIVAPLAAAAGVPVAKMSGRGLGHTGGTIDKLESFRGFRTDLNTSQFAQQVERIGVAIVGQTGNLTPADKKLYALRDVTATVHSIPLIAASIMSKKIAAGADAIVLDVKVGEGAFMESLEQAKQLAAAMVDIGNLAGRETVALISDMNRPLGHAIGNALEVREAIRVLKNIAHGPLRDVSLAIAAKMALLSGRYANETLALDAVTHALESGAALQTLRKLVEAQGGEPAQVDDPERLPQASFEIPITAHCAGYIRHISASKLGQVAMLLGAGRADKNSVIDLAVGVQLQTNVGNRVHSGSVLCVLHSNKPSHSIEHLLELTKQAFTIAEQPLTVPPLLHGWVTTAGFSSASSSLL